MQAGFCSHYLDKGEVSDYYCSPTQKGQFELLNTPIPPAQRPWVFWTMVLIFYEINEGKLSFSATS